MVKPTSRPPPARRSPSGVRSEIQIPEKSGVPLGIRGVGEDFFALNPIPPGRYGIGMFRYITVPSIRPALVVVLTTIAMTTLKVFDIVLTMTNGQWNTEVLANLMFKWMFVSFDYGRGSAIAVVIIGINDRQALGADAPLTDPWRTAYSARLNRFLATLRAASARPGDEWTVSAVNAAAKELIEGVFPPLWISGEIANFTRARSGHCYFTLRDEGSQLRCVMWRDEARRLPTAPEEGMAVRALGRLTLYPARGDFQVVVSELEGRGEGLWKLALERLRVKLEAEGLTAPERKRPIPRHPAVVGGGRAQAHVGLTGGVEALQRGAGEHHVRVGGGLGRVIGKGASIAMGDVAVWADLGSCPSLGKHSRAQQEHGEDARGGEQEADLPTAGARGHGREGGVLHSGSGSVGGGRGEGEEQEVRS